MSFGCGVADVRSLIHLARWTVEGASEACGSHDDLTQELSRLHDILGQLHLQQSTPGSAINLARGHRRTELQDYMVSCEAHLRTISLVLAKYNDLSDEERCRRKLWQKIRFGNGEIIDVADVRSKISTYTTAITILFDLMSLGSRGRVERQLCRQKGRFEEIRESINFALAQVISSRESSVMTNLLDDSKTFWRGLRRKLMKDGFSRSAIDSKKELILSYVKELDARGVLDHAISSQKSFSICHVADEQPWQSSDSSCSYDQIISPIARHPNSDAIPQAIELSVRFNNTGSTNRTLVEPFCEREGFTFGEKEAKLSYDDMLVHSDPTAHCTQPPPPTSPNGSFIYDLERADTAIDPLHSNRSHSTTWPDNKAVNALYERDSDIVPATADINLGSPKIQPACEPLATFSPCSAQNMSDSTDESRALHDKTPELQSDTEPLKSCPTHGILENDERKRSIADKTETSITVQDPFGREFTFPYSLAMTWDVSRKVLL